MGRDYDKFYHEVTADDERSGFDLGHHGLINLENTFYSYPGEYFDGEDGRYLHLGGGGMAWDASFLVSNMNVRFTSKFRKRFHEELGTRLHFSTNFHPQTDG